MVDMLLLRYLLNGAKFPPRLKVALVVVVVSTAEKSGLCKEKIREILPGQKTEVG